MLDEISSNTYARKKLSTFSLFWVPNLGTSKGMPFRTSLFLIQGNYRATENYTS